MTRLADLVVASLGEGRYDSPLSDFVADRRTNEHSVNEDDRLVFHDTVSLLEDAGGEMAALPGFEPGGARVAGYSPHPERWASSPAGVCVPA